MQTIIVVVEGGMVQHVVIPDDLDVRVVVRDFDVDGREPDGEDDEGCPYVEAEYGLTQSPPSA